MSLARRTLQGISWNALANVISMVALFVRAVVLARLLPVEVFGIFGGAMAAIAATRSLSNMGIAGAFIHRSEFSDDEEAYARQHLSLKLIFTFLWVGALLGVARVFLEGADRLALSVLVVAGAFTTLTDTPRLLLVRRVVHRKLALLKVLQAVGSTVVAITMALAGYELWALLAAEIVLPVVAWFLFYVWRPVWRPRLGWSWPMARYFMRFGLKNFVASAVEELIAHLDDLWVRTQLGPLAMGFYSRAYTFANMPRNVLAAPFHSVVAGSYAELSDDRDRLSRYFFRINAIMLRMSLLAGGAFVLVAPEFITLVIGEKWLPMLLAFRILIVMTLLAPLKMTIGALFIAVGRPEQLMRVNFLQLAILGSGLLAASRLAPSIEGVATVVTGMLGIGVVSLLLKAREHVGVGLLPLALWPGVALAVGVVGGSTVTTGVGVNGMLVSAALKLLLFTVGFVGVLLVLERRESVRMAAELARIIGERDGDDR